MKKIYSVDTNTQETFVLMKTSWRRLSSLTSEDVFKTSSRRLAKTSSRYHQDVLPRMVFWKRCDDKFQNICAGISFSIKLLCRSATSLKTSLWRRCFLVNFAKFVRTTFLQNTTRRLLLIIAVSIEAKGKLANATVNYDTKTKEYVTIWARSVSIKRAVEMKQQVSEAVACRCCLN